MSIVMASATPSWEHLSQRLPPPAPPRLPELARRDFGGSSSGQVVLYRDSASWCPYCQRVWIQLEEKHIPYMVEKVNMNCYGPKPAWYTSMVPSGLLPALRLDGRLLTESLDIMMAIEAAFPDSHPLLPPAGSAKQAALPGLLRLERMLASAWLSTLRSGGGRDKFEQRLAEVEAALGVFDGGPFFLGQFSLLDAVYAPFLERMAASMPYWQGFQLRWIDRWPRLQAWFDAMDARPSYMSIKSDDFTIAHTLEPQVGRCKRLPAGQAYRELVDGLDGSWNLPLQPQYTAWGYDAGDASATHLEAAAAALVGNHAGVLKFALRGLPAAAAAAAEDEVDTALRSVAHALLVGVDNVAINTVSSSGAAELACAYVRDRVGVPRDLAYPAARQLRAHLHWFCKSRGT